jgi:histidyl-tRNA synthetase
MPPEPHSPPAPAAPRERPQAPRGTRDLLPAELARWQRAEDAARAVLARYDYREIRTPTFEDYAVFARTSGESSDIVSKEMYRFQDLAGRDLALRPEGTAGVARAWMQHGLGGQARLQRLWYMGPMFRYGRPQKGRWRQFWQIGAELIGTGAPGADVEMITLFVDLFEAWGFGELVVMLNSLGTPRSRQGYGDALRAWLAPAAEELSEDSRRRLTSNPLRVLDTKDPRELELFASRRLGAMPRLLDAIDAEDRAHFDAVRAGLEDAGIRHDVDHGLVRGLDYYTRTAFEVHDHSLGAQSALGGGGRYDGLIEDLGGPPTPAVGFSIGLDRVLLAIEQREGPAPATPPQVFVVAMDRTRDGAVGLVRALRRTLVVVCDVEGRKFGAQMQAAGKSGAAVAVILGEEEWARGEVMVKDLRSGVQTTVARADLEQELRLRRWTEA